MKQEKCYLLQAGKTIEIVFALSQTLYLQKNYIGQFKKVWESFLVRRRRPDFTIRVVQDELKDNVVVTKAGKKYYFLTFSRDFEHKKVTTYYSGSIRSMDILLKEIFAYLLKEDGFLLHCATIKRRGGKILCFLAPSGGGKSTTAKNLTGGESRKFGDDIILVRKLAGKWRFFSPPFIEKEGMPAKSEAVSGTFYIVKKSKKPYKRILEGKEKILPTLLGQIWLGEGGVSRHILANAISFLESHDFYELGATLNKAEMRKLLK